MRPANATGAVFAAALGMIGCDGPLKDGEALDRSTFSLSGTITPSLADGPLALGVLWVDPAQQGNGSYASGSELIDDNIESDGRFRMAFYSAPPDHAVRWLKAAEDSDAVVAFAWGELVLYEDRDGDGTFRVGPLVEGSPIAPPDVYRGFSPSHVLVYVAEPLPFERSAIVFLAGMLTEAGYRPGTIPCNRAGVDIAVEPTDPTATEIQLVDPSTVFASPRICMSSHPVRELP